MATNFEDRKPSHPDLKDVRLPELAESEGAEGLVPEGWFNNALVRVFLSQGL